MKARLVAKILYPGAFALVMATGIISSAAQLLAFPVLARILLACNALFFIALWLLTLVRLAFFFPRLRGDLLGHATGPGFFTVVAGTCVLGTQIVLVTGDYGLAMALWILGITLWLVLTYTFFAAVVTSSAKPVLGSGSMGAGSSASLPRSPSPSWPPCFPPATPPSRRGCFFSPSVSLFPAACSTSCSSFSLSID